MATRLWGWDAVSRLALEINEDDPHLPAEPQFEIIRT
jgi:hypothetical protein